jgi:hypothetical protein
MKKTKTKYTYDNWWSGDVTLIYSTYFFYKSDKPQLLSWTDFSDSEVEKILEKQKELFAGNVKRILDEHTSQFTKRINNSEMKSEYLKAEKKECRNIMFGNIPNVKIIHFKHWGIALDNLYLIDVRYYIDRSIKKGIDDGLEYIHSPNCKYQDKSKPDYRIYAKFLWEYYKWLNSFQFKEEKNILTSNSKTEVLKEPEVSRVTIKSKEHRNWFKVGLLFANGKMDKLVSKHKRNLNMPNFTAIATELGNKSFRPYISETIGGTNTNDKNIFSSNFKVAYIIDYCKKHDITVVDSFPKYPNKIN